LDLLNKKPLRLAAEAAAEAPEVKQVSATASEGKAKVVNREQSSAPQLLERTFASNPAQKPQKVTVDLSQEGTEGTPKPPMKREEGKWVAANVPFIGPFSVVAEWYYI
jgi:hypothetical protein